MTDPEPTAPNSLPKYLRDGVLKQDAETLEDLIDYAAAVRDWREQQAQRELEEEQAVERDETPEEWADQEDDWEEALDDARDEADLSAGKGTLTTKTIDGRGYYYLQWRDGDKIRSQYVTPVNPAGDD
jgi:hypothetical protein